MATFRAPETLCPTFAPTHRDHRESQRAPFMQYPHTHTARATALLPTSETHGVAQMRATAATAT
eukprot:12380734-Alexandrium_andersonii.AAC.1